MEFLQLKYFRHAAKSENFSHTAAAFMVPPSCVSSSIKKLESELNVSLFDRAANKISLNENGKVFLKTADSIFSQLEKAKNAMADISGQPNGRIKILINTNRRLMTKIISDFQSEYPKVSFVMDFGGNNNYSDYNIVITDSIMENSDFEHYDFISEEIMLAVHKTNPLSARKQVDMSILENEKFICLHKNHSLRTITDSLCSHACIKPNIVIECDDPQCIRDYLTLGIGVSLIPSISWANQFSSDIALIRINNGVYRHTKIYINKNSSSSSNVFFKHMKKYKSLSS
ncbi:MAG: LysR family transcriptional regulator [Clostridia bacterium]|nr:LysR family transcriptional regulator [Clostridia bacterium]